MAAGDIIFSWWEVSIPSLKGGGSRGPENQIPIPSEAILSRRHEQSRSFRGGKRSNMFAIKAGVSDPGAEAFAFSEQKTMYGGKHIACGDTIFVFASENEGGQA